MLYPMRACFFFLLLLLSRTCALGCVRLLFVWQKSNSELTRRARRKKNETRQSEQHGAGRRSEKDWWFASEWLPSYVRNVAGSTAKRCQIWFRLRSMVRDVANTVYLLPKLPTGYYLNLYINTNYLILIIFIEIINIKISIYFNVRFELYFYNLFMASFYDEYLMLGIISEFLKTFNCKHLQIYMDSIEILKEFFNI